jgi:thiopeptide-type bacteriocin biosynthesis protein
MDTLLTDLGFDMEQRREIIRQARAAFAAEFRADAGLKHQLGSRFRQERCSVEKLLNQNDHADEWSAARTILQCRSDFLKPIVAQLHAAEREGRLTLPMSTLAPSFIHMHINRLLLASQREQEFILYDFLDRHYESLAARSRSRRRT